MLYVGLDIHVRTTSLTIRSANGAVIARDVVLTTREALRRRFRTIRGNVAIVCEAGPLSGWVASLLSSRCRKVIVSDPRQNRLLMQGSKTDRVDADKLSELLRLNAIRPVFVGDREIRELKRLVSHYFSARADRRRILHRLRGVFTQVGAHFAPTPRQPTRVPFRRLPDSASRFIVRTQLQQLAAIHEVIVAGRRELLGSAAVFPAFQLLQTVPYVGPMRAAALIAIVGVPSRFPSVRQFWTYAGLAVTRRTSAEHRSRNGGPVREPVTRGLHLNRNRNQLLKKILKDIALHASLRSGPFRDMYMRHIERGKTPAIARVALARKIAAVIRAVWKSGEPFVAARLSTTDWREHQRKVSVPAPRTPETIS